MPVCGGYDISKKRSAYARGVSCIRSFSKMAFYAEQCKGETLLFYTVHKEESDSAYKNGHKKIHFVKSADFPHIYIVIIHKE